MLSPKKIMSIEEVNGEIVQSERTIMKLNTIWSKGLLQETATWNPDGNFDRHDAVIMLMLLREDKMRLYGTVDPKEASNNRDANYLGNDSFFEKNYKPRSRD